MRGAGVHVNGMCVCRVLRIASFLICPYRAVTRYLCGYPTSHTLVLPYPAHTCSPVTTTKTVLFLTTYILHIFPD